jgi:hypothetical protein
MAGTTQSLPSEQQKSAADRLDSWKEIAAYLKRSVRTVHRWESEQGLPVHRHLHQSSGTVYAFRAELDAWWASRKIELEAAAETLEETPATAIASKLLSLAGLKRWLMVMGVVVLVAALASIAYWRKHVAANVIAIRSIAVIPFENLTGDSAQDYVVDSITDALTTELARTRLLGVASRTSASQYRGLVSPCVTLPRT